MDEVLGDGWFGTLVNGGLGAYQSSMNAQAAIATAQAQAQVAEQRRVEAAQQQALALSMGNSKNSQYVMWGMGLFALLFLVRATNRG